MQVSLARLDTGSDTILHIVAPCPQAAEKARREEEKAEAEARRLRAIAEREAKEAKEAEDARKLAALVAQAQQDAKRWTIGQRVRLKDGQVGTVANIRIAGATGLDWVRVCRMVYLDNRSARL